MERTPRPGEFYRHFKNKLYQVIGIAVHSETGEKMVVYQALYGDYGMYVRPLSMFVSLVDREKYPQATQKYRFEKVNPAEFHPSLDQEVQKESQEETAEGEPSPGLMRFLEAENAQDRIYALKALKGKATQVDLDCIYAVLELPAQPGDLEEQMEAIKKCLEMQQRYDGSRLREGRRQDPYV